MLWDPSSPSEAPLYILVRWFSFSAIVLAIGALLFPRVADTALRSVVTRDTVRAVAAALRQVTMAAAGAVAIAAVLRLVMQRAMLSAAFAPEVIRGVMWSEGPLVPGSGCSSPVRCSRLRRLGRSGGRVVAAALAIAAMAVSPGLSGHAATGSRWR
jgi:hypothetical protein